MVLICAQQLLVLKTTLIPNQEDQRPILTPSKAGYPASMIDSVWFTVHAKTSTFDWKNNFLQGQMYHDWVPFWQTWRSSGSSFSLEALPPPATWEHRTNIGWTTRPVYKRTQPEAKAPNVPPLVPKTEKRRSRHATPIVNPSPLWKFPKQTVVTATKNRTQRGQTERATVVWQKILWPGTNKKQVRPPTIKKSSFDPTSKLKNNHVGT